jgi:hypothetical protein
MPKYRFRKVYIVCQDNQIFGRVTMNNFYQNEEECKQVAKYKLRQATEDAKYEWAKNKPIPKFATHGFYLVHESLFDELLKNSSK